MGETNICPRCGRRDIFTTIVSQQFPRIIRKECLDCGWHQDFGQYMDGKPADSMPVPEYAERRLEEAIKNGEMCDVQYWRGYRDAVKRMMDDKMYTDTFKGRGCAKCPVNQWECDAQYRGSRCKVLRWKAGADFDPNDAEVADENENS